MYKRVIQIVQWSSKYPFYTFKSSKYQEKDEFRHCKFSKNNFDSAVISALGYGRSKPGFESRQPQSDFSSTQLN